MLSDRHTLSCALLCAVMLTPRSPPQPMSRDIDMGQHDVGPQDKMQCATSGLACFTNVLCCCGPACFGCQQVDVNSEVVMLLFGKYYTTLRSPGMYCINKAGMTIKVMSTKRQNMNVGPQKVADKNGNPIMVSGVVAWRVLNAKRAALDVENFNTYVSIQAHTILKQVVSRYPYEASDGQASLKTETAEIGAEMKSLLQVKANVAGVMIESFDLSDLSYAPEIAQMMLVRQQAKAMVDARSTIVQGAVGIVTSAISGLKEHGIEMDSAEQARLTTSLLTVICGESGATPTINVGQ